MGRTFPEYQPGDPVRIRAAYPPGHVRTPHYVRGHSGTVERVVGRFPDPEERAFGRSGQPGRTLYRIRIPLGQLWADYAGDPRDDLEVEIYEHWLEPA